MSRIQRRRTGLVPALLVALFSMTSACTSNESDRPAAATTTARAPFGGTPPSTTITVEQGNTNQRFANTTGDAQRLAVTIGGLLRLEPIELTCLAARLDQQPDLRDALGPDPANSPRYQEITPIAQDCIRTTTGAITFSEGIAKENPHITPRQTGCLADTYASLPTEAINAIVQAALEPNKADPESQHIISDILTSCTVDPESLTNRPPR